MRRALLFISAAMVGALAPIAPAHAREAPDTILQDDAELLFRSDERVSQNMRHLRSLGVDRVRLNAGWSSIAPDPDSLQRPDLTLSEPDSYPRANWRRLDRAVRAAHDAGLQVMIDIAFWAPRWATTGNPEGTVGRERWNVDPAAFAEFTAAVVKRYSGDFVPEPDVAPAPQSGSPDHQLLEGPLGSLVGGGGVLPPPPPPAKDLGPLPKVSWWTIWNEPNHPGFLQAATSFKLALFVDCVTPSVRPARRKQARKQARKLRGRRRGESRSRRPERRLVIWGHVRPGASAQRVVLEESRGSSPAWQKTRTARAARARKPAAYSRRAFVTSTSGVFVRHAPWRRDVRYRLRIPGPPGTAESGLAVRPLPCGRKLERVARDDGEY